MTSDHGGPSLFLASVSKTWFSFSRYFSSSSWVCSSCLLTLLGEKEEDSRDSLLSLSFLASSTYGFCFFRTSTMIIKIRQRYTTQTSSILEVRYQELVMPVDVLTRKKPNGPNTTSGKNSPAASTHRTGARNQTTGDVTAGFSKAACLTNLPQF